MSRATPSAFTKAANATVANTLPFNDNQDFTDALRGKISELYPRIIYKNGSNEEVTVWDLSKYDFQQQLPDKSFPPCPDSCNPSLWRVGLLNAISGVFEVVPEKIFQIRCYDVANITAIRGDTGWLIIDPLTSAETAEQAMINLNRVYNQRYPSQATANGDLPIKAVFFTHSHVDHYAGVFGLVPNYDGGELPFPVYAPPGFLEEAVSENVIAGTTMTRRAMFQFGQLLPTDAENHVDVGIGKSTGGGTGGIYAAHEIQFKHELYTMKEDGIDIILLNAPNTEAPAEMMLYFPGCNNAFCSGENVTHTLHNLLTPRGAKVRDPLEWSKCLNKVLHYFPNIEIIFASHNWPTWSNRVPNGPLITNRVSDMIKKQRDLYKYIHDQSMRMTNNGYTIQEVAEAMELPTSLDHEWCNRGFYGTVIHNSKAVYQRYIGWFDANPASLHQLPPAKAGSTYMRYMGGLANIVSNAQTDYNLGRYREVAMVLNNAIFGTHRAFVDETLSEGDIDLRQQAINLLANTYDQLGYQAESGAWRSFYLTGANELRNGGPLGSGNFPVFNSNTVHNMSFEMMCDYLSTLVDPTVISDTHYVFNVTITPTAAPPSNKSSSTSETNGRMTWHIENSVLTPDFGHHHGDTSQVTAEIVMSRDTLNSLVLGTSGNELINDNKITINPGTGGEAQVRRFFKALNIANVWFNIVFPNYY